MYSKEERRLWGLATSQYLEQLHSQGRPLSDTDPLITQPGWMVKIEPILTIQDLLDLMAGKQAAIISEVNDDTPPRNEFVWGLFTISDFNKRGFREAMYKLLFHLESKLAALAGQVRPPRIQPLRSVALP